MLIVLIVHVCTVSVTYLQQSNQERRRNSPFLCATTCTMHSGPDFTGTTQIKPECCAGAVSSNQMAVQSSAPQKAVGPTRPLPAQRNPVLHHSSSNSASRQPADASCSAGRSGSLTADYNSSAGTMTAAQEGGKGRPGGGVTVLDSEGSCGSSIQGVGASACLASSSCGRSGGMGSGLDAAQEGTEGVSHSEGVSFRGVPSPAQVRGIVLNLAVCAACDYVTCGVVHSSHRGAVFCPIAAWCSGRPAQGCANRLSANLALHCSGTTPKTPSSPATITGSAASSAASPVADSTDLSSFHLAFNLSSIHSYMHSLLTHCCTSLSSVSCSRQVPAV